MNKKELTIDVLKAEMWICIILLTNRISAGLSLCVIALIACYCVFKNKHWLSLSCFILFSVFRVTNAAIRPRVFFANIALNLGMILIELSFLLTIKKRSGNHSIPLKLLLLYMTIAFISSTFGYMPIISYMKIINFVLFISCIWASSEIIYYYNNDLYKLRCLFLAVCMFIIVGTYLTLPFHSIAYPQNMFALMSYGGLTQNEAAMLLSVSSETSFLAGILSHSNVLAPALCACFIFILCDMSFVERKIHKFHIILLLLSLPLMIFTRARSAFVILLISIFSMYFIINSMNRNNHFIKLIVKNSIILIVCFAIIGIVVMEIKDNGFSKYLRKTSNLQEDNRTLTVAMVESRMGLIDTNLNDFYKNPILGMGFQTSEIHKYLYQSKRISLFSAPIEKGVLPLMILGETGIIGAIIFIFWLISFFSICIKNNYIATICGMVVILASNLGESSFFAPSGLGGLLWIISIIGGYVCDIQIKNKNINNEILIGKI